MERQWHSRAQVENFNKIVAAQVLQISLGSPRPCLFQLGRLGERVRGELRDEERSRGGPWPDLGRPLRHPQNLWFAPQLGTCLRRQMGGKHQLRIAFKQTVKRYTLLEPAVRFGFRVWRGVQLANNADNSENVQFPTVQLLPG